MRRFAKRVALSLVLIAIPLSVQADKFDEIEKLNPDLKIEKYKELLAETPNSADVQFYLGNAYYDHGFAEEAAGSYRRAWEEGGEAKALLNLTFVLQELERNDEAAEVFKQGIVKLPDNAVVRALHGDFLSGGEDEAKAMAGAMEEYRYALHIDKDCIEAHFGLGVLFARSGILKEAVVEWERVIEIDSGHQLAKVATGNIERAREKIRGR